jgi:NAD(P)-dependent dehydrogenase (short-subunit alcohol dehydrogenase family)
MVDRIPAKELADQRVVITAGGAGIGLAAAEAFARSGSEVWICDVDQKALDRANDRLGIHGVLADVGSDEGMSAFFEAVTSAGEGIDTLVNNAGIAGPSGVTEDISSADANRVFDVNVTSIFRTCGHVVPIMRAQGSGSVINISSTAGQFGFPYRSPYAASKWAVIGITKTLAMEVGGAGVRVNAICPGSVAGPRMDHVIDIEAQASGRASAAIRAGFESQVSLQSFVVTSDIADAIVFLASAAAQMISGQVIAVDGHTETLRTD